MRKADLRVVSVVPRYERETVPFGFEVRDPRLDREQMEVAHKSAEGAVESMRKEVDSADDVQIGVTATLGIPAEEILDHAEGADLIVVGCRGVGGFKRLLLGSVSYALVQHAPCPVLIVRGEAATK
jgi:nucleotide-binding universal stress UspA family protein